MNEVVWMPTMQKFMVMSVMEGYSGDDQFWIWRGQVYAQEWLEKNPNASKARFEYVGPEILQYRINNEPTRNLCLRGWLSVYDVFKENEGNNEKTMKSCYEE